MLSRRTIGQHKVQGIADGLLPVILDLDYVDGIILVSSDDSIAMARDLSAQEGIFCGISSGCNVAAAKKVSLKHPDQKCIVTMINDNGLRYLSTVLCESEDTRTMLDREYKLSREDQDTLARYSFEIIE
jgi:cysteine synthase A